MKIRNSPPQTPPLNLSTPSLTAATLKSEKPATATKRRRRTAASSSSQAHSPSLDNIQDPQGQLKRRKHQKASSSSSNLASATSTPNLSYAVPTPPLSSASVPPNLPNVLDHHRIHNSNHIESNQSYPNILSNQGPQNQMSPPPPPHPSQQAIPPPSQQDQIPPPQIDSKANIRSPYEKLQAETVETWLSLGSMADALDMYDRAIECYENALKHDPKNITALVGIAAQYRSKEQFFKAIEFYDSALKIDQNQGSVWEAIAHCHLMVDNLNDSYKAYQRAINLLPDPNVPKLWYGIAILYDRCGSFDLAKEAFVRVLRIDQSYNKKSDIYFRLGIIYKHEQKYQQALENFNLVLNNPPPPLAVSDIWFQIGHIQETLEDLSAAQYSYERVLEDNPSHAKVLQQLGWLHYQQYMKGITQITAVDGTSQSTMELAISRLSQSIDYEIEDPYTWYLLGRCYMQQERHPDAYKAYTRAVSIDGGNPRFWCSIGILYYRTGEYRVALESYTRAIRMAPDTLGEPWYNAAILYEVSNSQINDAINAVENAVRADPQNELYRNHLNALMALHRDLQQNPESRPVLPEELSVPREPPVPVDRPLPNKGGGAGAEQDRNGSVVPGSTIGGGNQEVLQQQQQPHPALPAAQANMSPQQASSYHGGPGPLPGHPPNGSYVPIAPAPTGPPGLRP